MGQQAPWVSPMLAHTGLEAQVASAWGTTGSGVMGYEGPKMTVMLLVVESSWPVEVMTTSWLVVWSGLPQEYLVVTVIGICGAGEGWEPSGKIIVTEEQQGTVSPSHAPCGSDDSPCTESARGKRWL